MNFVHEWQVKKATSVNTNQNTGSVAVCDIVVLHDYTDTGEDDDEWTQNEQHHREQKQLASGVRIQRHTDTRSSIVIVSDEDALHAWRQVRLLLLLLWKRRIHHHDVVTTLKLHNTSL